MIGEKEIVMEHLTLETFKEKVCTCGLDGDEQGAADWKYKGDLPAIIDFYADWCQPCKIVSPILEEIAEEYKDRLVVYKVNTEQENMLAGMFGIRSIPSILFIPMEEKPQMAVGALPKNEIKRIIQEVLGITEQVN